MRRLRPSFLGIAALLAATLAGCGGSAASPTKVAEAAGASHCDNSGFYIESKLTDKKETIYDCRFPAGLPKCVTYSGNIASNSTDEVSLLFEGSLNARKPACLLWVRQAKAHRAKVAAERAAARAAARLKQKRADYSAVLKLDRVAGWHKGYSAWNGDPLSYKLPTVYYKFLNPNSYSCDQYSEYGCFKIEIVTRDGCNSVDITISESRSRGSAQIGSVDGYSGAINATVPAIIEVDEDNGSTHYGTITSIDCY